MEDKARTNNQRIIWASLAITILVISGGLFGVVVPIVKKVFANKDALEKSKLEYEESKKEIEEIEGLGDSLKNVKEKGAILEEALIKEETAISFIDKIEAAANETNNQIAISSVEPPKIKKSENKNNSSENKKNNNSQNSDSSGEKIYFQIKTEGNYSQFFNFLCRLENLGFIFEIESISLDAQPKSVFGTNWQKEKKETKPESILKSNITISFLIEKNKTKK